MIARLEVNGYTVDLLTGAITRDGEIAVIRDSERASPPTDAANALVATWQRGPGHRRRRAHACAFGAVGSSRAALPEWRPAGRLRTLHLHRRRRHLRIAARRRRPRLPPARAASAPSTWQRSR